MKIKKISFLAIVVLILPLFLGCSDPKYMSEKMFWQAEQEVSKILKGKNNQLEEEDYNKVVSAYRKLIEAYPLEEVSLKAQFAISKLFVAQGKFDEAQNELKSIIQNFASKSDIASTAYFSIGNIYEAKGKWKEAYEEYDKIIDLYPLTSLGLRMPIYILQHYQKTKNENEQGNAYKTAVRHYDSLLEEYKETPVYPVISDHLALVHLQRGDKEKSLDVLDSIVEEYPDSLQAAKSFLVKGDIFSRKKEELPKGIESYEEFIDKYPQSKLISKIKLKLGLLYFQNQQLNESKDVFYGVLKDYSDNPPVCLDAYLGLSYCFRKENNTDELMEIYGKVKKDYPDSKMGLSVPVLVAQHYKYIKNEDKAEISLKDAISEYEFIIAEAQKETLKTRTAVSFLALCYLAKDEKEKTVELLKGMADKYSSNPTYLLDLAVVYTRINARDKAVETFEKVLLKYPDNKKVTELASYQLKVLKESITK